MKYNKRLGRIFVLPPILAILGVVELSDVIRKRRMYRSFSGQPVSEEQVREILKAALQAPSAGFTQGVEYLALTKKEAVRLFLTSVTTPGWLEQSRSHSGLRNGGAVLVPFYDKERYLARYREGDKSYSTWQSEENWAQPFWLVDCAFSVMIALLKVTELGLGCVFISVDRGVEELKEQFNVPANLEPLGALVIGYPEGGPSGSPQRKTRRAFEEVAHLETF